MKKLDNYFCKISDKLFNSAIELKNILDKEIDKNNEFDLDSLMKKYFGKYWKEYQEFWAQSREKIDWISYALAPHNSVNFIMYVFKEYPEVYKRVKEDFDLK